MFPEFGETAPCRLKSGEVIWTPVSLDDALRLVADFVTYYNNKRLHSAIGYVAPVDKLNAEAEEIFKARDQKLEAARAARTLQRQALMPAA